MCTDAEQQAGGSAGQHEVTSANQFDGAELDRLLAGSMFHGKVHHFTNVESTQTLAIADAHAGAEAGQVYLADEQTAGRGRGGHSWHSEPGSGLYLTALVRPRLHADAALLISLAAGIAVQEALQQVAGLLVDLRWPNDLVTMGPGSLKLGGILTETAMQTDGHLRYAAIGIGLNLNQPMMPPELQQQATSLLLINGKPASREHIAGALLQRLDAGLQQLTREPDSVLARFAECSTWVREKRVQVAEDGGYTGVTNGLTDTGLLRVRCDDGRERIVRHGGVREAMLTR